MSNQGADPNALLLHAEWLRRLASQLVREPTAAEDAVQDTWLAAVRRPPDASRPARPWLAQVLRNLVRTRARAYHGKVVADSRVTLEAAAQAPLPSAQELLERHELLRLLAGLVSDLEEPFRSTVLLWCQEGLAPSEIANRQSVPAGTVRWRLKKALDALRRELDRRHKGDRRVWSLMLGPLVARDLGSSASEWSLGKGMLLATAKTKATAAAVVVVIIVGGLSLWRWSGGRVPRGPLPPPSHLGPALFAPDPEVDPSLATGNIEGIVRDPEGKPVDDVVMTLARGRLRNSPSFTGPPIPSIATTAGGGQFRFTDLQAGDYAITAMAPSWAPAQKGTVEVRGKETTRLDLQLGRGGITLSGRVLDVGGGLVVGARVLAYAFGLPATGTSVPRVFQALSGSDGTYRLWLARGDYGLRAEAEGYAPIAESVSLGSDQTQDLKMMPAARIVGRVVNRQSRQPVPGADVWLVADRAGGYGARDVRSDEDGRFAFNDLEPGTYGASARKGELIGSSRMVSVAATETAKDVEVALDPGLTVGGSVLDSVGRGIEGARVGLQKSDPPFDRAVFGKSTAEGAYKIEGALPGKYRLDASSEGYGRAFKIIVLERSLSDANLVLAEAIVVRGVVLGPEGKPVEGAHVEARVEPQQRYEDVGWSMDRATSDTEGRFELKQLGPGKMTLTGQHPEHGWASIGPEVIAAGEKKTVTLELNKAGSISGMVRLDDGKAASGIRVTAFPWSGAMAFGGGPTLTDTTRADGQFTIGPLKRGAFRVAAAGKGLMRVDTCDGPECKTVHLDDGEKKSGVDLVIPKGGLSISGVVVGPSGQPLAGATVTSSIEDGGRAFQRPSADRVLTGSDGTFTLEDLVAGSYTLWAFHSEFADGELKGVAAGKRNVRLPVSASGSISGLVVSKEGKPLPDYTIAAMVGAAANETPDEKRSRLTSGYQTPVRRIHDASGAFEMTRLRAGAYDLKVTAADGKLGSAGVSLQPGEKKQGVRIEIASGIKVVGRVVEYGSGTPLPTVRISAHVPAMPSRPVSTVSDDKGAFTLEGLPGGSIVQLNALGNPDTHVPLMKELEIPRANTDVDIGALTLLKGNWPALKRTPNRGSDGMEYDWKAAGAVVKLVKKGEAGDKAGIKVGDIILAVDGKEVREVGMTAMYYLLAGMPGKSISVTAQTPGSAPRTVTLTLL